MTEMASTAFLPSAIRRKVEQYVWKHYQFSKWPLAQEMIYTFTLTNRITKGKNGEGIWFVRVVVPSLQAAYGLFVCVWEDGDVGGVLDDEKQKMFTFIPPESSPVVTDWPNKP